MIALNLLSNKGRASLAAWPGLTGGGMSYLAHIWTIGLTDLTRIAIAHEVHELEF